MFTQVSFQCVSIYFGKIIIPDQLHRHPHFALDPQVIYEVTLGSLNTLDNSTFRRCCKFSFFPQKFSQSYLILCYLRYCLEPFSVASDASTLVTGHCSILGIFRHFVAYNFCCTHSYLFLLKIPHLINSIRTNKIIRLSRFITELR